MGSKGTKKLDAMYRLNTRITHGQAEYVKNEVMKSKGTLSEGDVYRQLLSEAITGRKNK